MVARRAIAAHARKVEPQSEDRISNGLGLVSNESDSGFAIRICWRCWFVLGDLNGQRARIVRFQVVYIIRLLESRAPDHLARRTWRVVAAMPRQEFVHVEVKERETLRRR